jgi:1-pyrroline-5-carboxylate dehydrogenase
MYGNITFKVAEQMRKPEIADYFAKLIQRTSPKSYAQASGEVYVTTKFLENFCGDQVLLQPLARGYSQSLEGCVVSC